MIQLIWMLLTYFVTIASSASPQQLEGCYMSYDPVSSRINFNFDWIKPTGSPGIQGPVGAPGPKGEAGTSGVAQGNILAECNAKIQQLVKKIDKLTNAQRLEKLHQFFVDGWKAGNNEHFYYVSKEGMTWRQAVIFCAGKKARLATVGPRNLAMFNFLWNLAPTNGHLWIGLSDITIEGGWKWIDGISSDSSNTLWLQGQPGNIGNGQDCGVIFEGWKGGFDDFPCLSVAPKAVCEIASP